ncbi:Coronin-like protein crn1, partial [Tulasnella sp. 408]
MPFWSDNGIIFLAGKGDGNIRAYEWESDNLYALSEYSSTNPQRGLCFVPRRALNVSECEIARAYKVSGTTIEPISFIVPRRSDSFQADIFPPAPSLEPALTAAEFFNGKTAPRNLVDLDTGSVSTGPPPSATTSSFKVTSPEPPKTSSALNLSPETVKSPSQVPLPKTPAPSEPVSATPSRSTSIPVPTVSVSSSDDSKLREENDRLNQELREARAQIRNLELQVETLKANAVKAKA